MMGNLVALLGSKKEMKPLSHSIQTNKLIPDGLNVFNVKRKPYNF